MAKRKRTNLNRGYEDDYSFIPRGQAYQPSIVIQDVLYLYVSILQIKFFSLLAELCSEIGMRNTN